MTTMRRKEKMVTDLTEIKKIIDKCKVIRVAFNDEEGLYILPLNFGYELIGDKLKFYFHGAKQGRKARFLESPEDNVAFELDCNHALDDNDIACKVGFFYSSIIGTGVASIIEDDAKKVHAIEKLMVHQTAKKYQIKPDMLKNVIVFEITSDQFTCKQDIAQ